MRYDLSHNRNASRVRSTFPVYTHTIESFAKNSVVKRPKNSQLGRDVGPTLNPSFCKLRLDVNVDRADDKDGAGRG